MRLNPPTQVDFVISLVLAVLALIGQLLTVPLVTPYRGWLALAAFLVLAAGALLKRV